MKLMRLKSVILLIFTIILSACLTENPKDVAIHNLQLIRVPSITGDLGRYNKENEDIPVLKLDISSSFDFLGYINEKELLLSVIPYFCDLPDKEFGIKKGDLLANGIEFRDLIIQDAVLTKNKSGKYIYSLILGLYSDRHDNPSFTLHAYDLVVEPKDICFSIMASKLITGGSRSNLLRIPSELIIRETEKLKK